MQYSLSACPYRQPADSQYTSEQRGVKQTLWDVQQHATETGQGDKEVGDRETAASLHPVGAGAPEEKRQGLRHTTRQGAQGEDGCADPSDSDE